MLSIMAQTYNFFLDFTLFYEKTLLSLHEIWHFVSLMLPLCWILTIDFIYRVGYATDIA